MDLLLRPTGFVHRLLGKRPLLLYGDVDGEFLTLTANEPLPGYEPKGAVSVRHLSQEAGPYLTDGQAYVYPRRKTVMRSPDFVPEVTIEEAPCDEVKEVFHVDRSFGYIPSAALLEIFYPGVSFGLKTFPSDISLAHEGAHVVSINEIRRLLPAYLGIVSPDVTSRGFHGEPVDERENALIEAVAFFVEDRYVDEFHPGQVTAIAHHRAGDEHPEYIEADRLVRHEAGRLEFLVSAIREINQTRS
ncbi:MAG: hypothetical protein HY369_01240 [Candidatus Aenigmarchaeota archaeon]|nr:hypothetical protein [Candidatus Aenigmarchaeota archaeon]